MAQNYENYSQVKDRLDSIVDKVTDENISLDEALDLYDEAVKLAMRASDLIEIDTDDGIDGVDDDSAESEPGAKAELREADSIDTNENADKETEEDESSNSDSSNSAEHPQLSNTNESIGSKENEDN